MRWPTVVFRVLLGALLAPALGLTALRLAQPDAGLAVRLISFAPVAILAYGVALALLVGKLVFPGRESWKPWAAVTAVVAVGLGLHLSWILPQFTGDAAKPAADGFRLQVMTLNLHLGKAEPARVVETAALDRVDLLVLQEVTPGTLAELEKFGLADAYPHRAGSAGPGAAGTMVFSSYPLAGADRLGTKHGSWAVDVATPRGRVRVYAVHPRAPFGDAVEWHDDLALLLEAAEDDRELDLVVGDFNATPEHDEFRAFAEGADLHSAAELADAGWSPTWADHRGQSFLGVPLPPLVQIDHVLVGRSMTATEVDTFSIDGTDHRGVVAEVAFRR